MTTGSSARDLASDNRGMKMRADRIEGQNAIARHGPDGVVVNGVEHTESVIVPWPATCAAWDAPSFERSAPTISRGWRRSSPSSSSSAAAPRLRFPPPALLRPLIEARIGVETMDTAAACRTYNVLVAEGRWSWLRCCFGGR